jgi:cytochrome bd ubiquinol oxidase subunit II
LSGFYLPFMIMLWLLVGRALAIELRHQIDDPMWRQLLDGGFFVSSLALGVIVGAALGNVFRGVSLDEGGRFFAPLWTNFGVGDRVGMLDWFTILVGVTAVVALAHHGALWLSWSCKGEVRDRAGRIARVALIATFGLTLVVLVAGYVVRPTGSPSVARHVGAMVLSGVSLAGLVASGVMRSRGRAGFAFLGSCVYLYATVGAGAALLHPYLLPARDPALGLTIVDAAASPSSLGIALAWWVPGMALVAVYTTIVYRSMRHAAGESGGP